MKEFLGSRLLICCLGIILLNACDKQKEPIEEKIFKAVPHSQTGLEFRNDLTENDSLNYFTYSYIYMGGGVATGDINNDGLLDIYFTGNQVPNKLYLNKGDMKFEDITEKAGVTGDDRWYTGVTMADINGDGYLDIYCSVSGKYGPRNNQLFLNNGDGTFSEKAAEYQIDDTGNSVQATFFDYDKDGDLDLYVANYPPTRFNSPTFVYVQNMRNVQDEQTDKLYRNNGDRFEEVTDGAGLRSFGLSLSATVGDINNDSWPDIYVSNDFNSPDFMYINNQDGTFREVIKQATSHTSFYGMGADIADFNNDGYLDIFQVDMDAKDNRRKKANMASMNPDLFKDIADAGFQYQYMHNCMQLNSGSFTNGVPHFSNVSRITGTSSTDWSWGPLFADFDNDGLKDLFVSNGTRREINNNDYFNRLKTVKIEADSTLDLSLNIPSEKIDNFIFKNKGNLQFERANDQWGISYKGFSNGVAYADLDNDGDLEIITNNIDDHAAVFQNGSSEMNGFLKIRFQGDPGNNFGVGNRVYLTSDGTTQLQELTLTRGFQSSVAPELIFGIGKAEKIDMVRVVWTNGKVQELANVEPGQTLLLKQGDAQSYPDTPKSLLRPFETDTTGLFPDYRHTENYYDDFSKQVLLPHKMSTFGPTLVVGDLNSDGRDDYFVGGSTGYTGTIFLQSGNGFEKRPVKALEEDKIHEDTGALIFDADGDGDNDLYVASGGYEFSIGSPHLQDRLYLNDGKGNFTRSASALPPMSTSSSKVYKADFDQDGKEDILVLGRQVPGKYPMPATTHLLRNTGTNGTAQFKEFPESFSRPFLDLGMATSAVVTDINNNKRPDIIIVGEWMPIKVFENSGEGFREVSEKWGLDLDSTGWWWSIAQGDFDKDGDTDYILGNNGLNYKYKATENETFDIFVNDFDRDNKEDIVLSYYNDGKQYPLRGRECSSQQIPGIKQKFQDYESFSTATLEDVYTEKSLESALHYQVKSFASVYMENQNGKFVLHQLPREAQLSSINQILVDDYDLDGALDLLIAGNLYASEVETPRNDAGYGLYLKGNGRGSFTPVEVDKSGFFVPGDVKDVMPITAKSGNYLIVAKNNDQMQYIKIK
ncbi:MAG: VCBS repeat-containing protein [Sediminicola sp.]